MLTLVSRASVGQTGLLGAHYLVDIIILYLFLSPFGHLAFALLGRGSAERGGGCGWGDVQVARASEWL